MKIRFVVGVLGVLSLGVLLPVPAEAFGGCVYQGRIGPVSYYFCPPPGYKGEVPKLPGVGAVSVGFPKALPLPPLSAGLPRVLDEIILEAARRYAVDTKLIRAVIEVESNWNPWAVSQRGAQGLMQLMPETARRLGVRNSFDAKENIGAGVRHLGELLQEFQDVRLALAAYNAGAEAVRRCRCVPQNSETPFFVEAVLRRYRSG